MKKKFYAAVLPACLAAAVLFIRTPGAGKANAQTLPTEEEYISEKPEEDPGFRREKYYLLEAMDKLDEKGLSPIRIWSKITGNEKVVNSIKSLGQSAADTVTETVSEKAAEAGEVVSGKLQEAGNAAASQVQETVQEAGNAAAEQAKDAIQQQTENARQSLLDKFREWVRGLFESNTGSGKETSS